MNEYLELKEQHQKEVNNFPMMFAYCQKQFKEGMQKLGLKETEIDKIYSLKEGMQKLGLKETEIDKVYSFKGTLGYYKKTDSKKLKDMFEKHDQEMQEAINNDVIGDNFIFEMFSYELANHEYSYTGDLKQTLNALNLTQKDINNNKNLVYGLNKAIEYCLS